MSAVLLTGAAGQLGREIASRWATESACAGHRLIETDVEQLDICDRSAVMAIMEAHGVGLVINCAAYTAVDKAEAEPDAAMRINALGVENLASAVAALGAAMIHISTDYVFDGTSCTPYAEDAAVSPSGVYGMTKLAGEEAMRLSGCRGVIVRTSWLYSAFGHNFVKTMLRLGSEKAEVCVVDDQWGCPTWAGSLAGFILGAVLPRLLGRDSAQSASGDDFTRTSQDELRGEVYHYSDSGATNWCGLAGEVMRLAELPCRVIPVATAQYPTAARRPAYSVLDKSKAERDFGVKLRPWEDALAQCIATVRLTDDLT